MRLRYRTRFQESHKACCCLVPGVNSEGASLTHKCLVSSASPLRHSMPRFVCFIVQGASHRSLSPLTTSSAMKSTTQMHNSSPVSSSALNLLTNRGRTYPRQSRALVLKSSLKITLQKKLPSELKSSTTSSMTMTPMTALMLKMLLVAVTQGDPPFHFQRVPACR